MGEKYETSYPKIEEVEAKIFEWHKGAFLKERDVNPVKLE